MSFYRMTKLLMVAIAVYLGVGSALAESIVPSPTNPPVEASILATVNGLPVTAGDLEQALRIPLYDLDSEKYRVIRRRLDQVIAERLIEQAAAARGMTVSAFLSSEIQARVPAIPQTEVDARLQQVREQLPQELLKDEVAAKQLVRNALMQERSGRALRDLVEELSREAKVSIAVRPPDRPVLPIPIGDDPAWGPAAAPVTIVEFGDFECPVCKENLPVLQRLRSLYPEQVRFVYRDFPLAAHAQARAAAEAAQCAHEQGKFWAYHDALFTKAPDLKPSDYPGLAESLKLDTVEFAACLLSNRPKAAVSKDLADARKLGLSGTPTFFVNGRYLVGLQTLEGLREAVDRELAAVANGSRGQLSIPEAAPR
jgi:protein-disulfide isomerase